jgi:hypothetical protein
VTEVVICILIVVWDPHWPEAGVKVYVLVPVVAVDITAGFHEPLMPLREVPGKASGEAPTQ